MGYRRKPDGFDGFNPLTISFAGLRLTWPSAIGVLSALHFGGEIGGSYL